MSFIETNIRDVQNRIREAAKKQNKTIEDTTLVAVTKNFPVSIINEAIRLGINNVGENRIQEARAKFPELDRSATRHFIGHLQRNKVKYAVKLFDMIQSVDNVALGEELDARCAKMNCKMPVLIEVNTSGEASKFGCEPREAFTLLKALDRLPHLTVRGFMTVALYSDDPEKVRPCFKLLREIYEEAQMFNLENTDIGILSMGMSSDFSIAIEEGSNMVRIGTAIFGERQE